MAEWVKNYVLNKSCYFINYEDIRDKIEIKCKEIEKICDKYSIDNKIKIFDKEVNIIINGQEMDVVSWEIIDENIEFKSKNKKVNILLNGMNTYTVMYKRSCEYKDTIDNAIDCVFEKLLN